MQPTELLDFQNVLLNELALGTGLKGLAPQISHQFAHPIILANSAYRVIACASPQGELETEKYLRVSPQGAETYRISGLFNGDKAGSVFPISNQELLGYLVVCHEGPPSDELKALADVTVKACTLEFARQSQLLLFERKYKDAFLFDLLYGNIESNEDIISHGQIWGWELHLPQCVVVFELDDYEQYSSDKQLVTILMDIMETEIKVRQNPVIFRKKGQVTTILTVPQPKAQERKAYIDLMVKRILTLAEEKLSPRVARVGSGRTYCEPNEIFRSYQEAKVALELGRIMDFRTKTPFFRDLGLARILYNHDQQELAEFFKDTLGELARYDLEQSVDLQKTLEKYLLNRCDLKAAADALYLHPNTLRYRLKKIEEILEIDLNDFDTKLDLMTALKIRHIKKV